MLFFTDSINRHEDEVKNDIVLTDNEFLVYLLNYKSIKGYKHLLMKTTYRYYTSIGINNIRYVVYRLYKSLK